MFIKVSFIVISLSLILLPLSVYAQSGNGTVESRLNQAQNRQGVVLDDANKANIISKCTTTQNKLIYIRQTSDTAIQKRIVYYSDVQKELQAIELRMMRQGVDSSEMDLLIGKIQQSLDKFTLKADDYGTVISDLIALDCKNKPELFYAGIVDLRQKRAELNSAAADLKQVLKDASKNTFEPLMKRLQA